MRDFSGKVAIVTGGASGIGLAMAECFAEAGAAVVLADIEDVALERAYVRLEQRRARVLAVHTDVSDPRAVEQLANRTLSHFGRVDVVCNNAGVAADGTLWEQSLDDWTWIIGTNLWSVIHGVRTFVPILLAQGQEGHIVNTASVAGLIAGPGLGAYKASKHAVVSLSETLRHELTERGASIGVSVLCPGFVRTRITESARNRPHAGTPAVPVRENHRQAIETGMAPERVAEQTLAAIRENRFWVLTHPEWEPAIRARMLDVTGEHDPIHPQA